MYRRSLGLLALLVGLAANVGAQNSTATVQFSSASYTTLEGAGVANLTITKMGTTTEQLAAYYKTRDGTAKAPSDYRFTGDDRTASVVFEPNETSKQIQIPNQERRLSRAGRNVRCLFHRDSRGEQWLDRHRDGYVHGRRSTRGSGPREGAQHFHPGLGLIEIYNLK